MVAGIGALIAGIASAIAQANATAASTNLGYENLNFQKRNADRQHRLSTAGRTDIYGNEQSFDELLNKWLINLTPMQSAITKAGEREQLASLTEDASRNRDLRRRQEQRSLEAGDVYDELLADFRYTSPKTEDAIKGELSVLQGAERSDAIRSGTAEIVRSMIRQGQKPNLEEIFQKQDDQLGSGLVDSLLRSRQGALGEANTRASAHNQRFLPALSQFEGTMDSVGQAQPRFGNLAEVMGGQQGDIIQAIMAALTNQSSQVGGAYGTLAKLIQSGVPDFGGIGSGFDSLLRSASSAGRSSGSATPAPAVAAGPMFNTSWMFDDDRTRHGSDRF